MKMFNQAFIFDEVKPVIERKVQKEEDLVVLNSLSTTLGWLNCVYSYEIDMTDGDILEVIKEFLDNIVKPSLVIYSDRELNLDLAKQIAKNLAWLECVDHYEVNMDQTQMFEIIKSFNEYETFL